MVEVNVLKHFSGQSRTITFSFFYQSFFYHLLFSRHIWIIIGVCELTDGYIWLYDVVGVGDCHTNAVGIQRSAARQVPRDGRR